MKIDETDELFLLAGVANPASLKEASQILSEGRRGQNHAQSR